MDSFLWNCFLLDKVLVKLVDRGLSRAMEALFLKTDVAMLLFSFFLLLLAAVRNLNPSEYILERTGIFCGNFADNTFWRSKH